MHFNFRLFSLIRLDELRARRSDALCLPTIENGRIVFRSALEESSVDGQRTFAQRNHRFFVLCATLSLCRPNSMCSSFILVFATKEGKLNTKNFDSSLEGQQLRLIRNQKVHFIRVLIKHIRIPQMNSVFGTKKGEESLSSVPIFKKK